MLTAQKIREIIGQENLILRNLQITQAYFELSEGMRGLVSCQDANWCTFAAHASKTAGYSIRHELLPESVVKMLNRLTSYREIVFDLRNALANPQLRAGQDHPRLVAQALMHTSLNIAQGNMMVFAELAGPFSRMITLFENDTSPKPAKAAAFLTRQFRPGPVEQGGQEYLIEAFKSYYHACFQVDPKKKAEHIFLANLLVGLHEQIRLQPYIANALCAPIETVLANQFVRPAVQLNRRAAALVRRLFGKIATGNMMFVSLPTGRLRMGQDVRSGAPYGKFPPDLVNLFHPRLQQLVNQMDHSLDTLTGSQADNWASLDDRMHFIVDLFRSHQQDELMFYPPFRPSQSQAIKAGVIPGGEL